MRSSSTGISDINYGCQDPVLDDLFIKQARAVGRAQRFLRAFSDCWTRRPTSSTPSSGTASSPIAQVRGWTIRQPLPEPALDTVWL